MMESCDHLSQDPRMKEKKQKKIPPMTKSDKNTIMNFIKNVDHTENWVNQITEIDSNTLFQSMSHILNHEFDFLPEEYIDASKTSEMSKVTIFDVLSKCDTIFRFAPAPSGHLHIGHIVPILLNVLLHSISKKLKRTSSLVIRIDDTKPDEEEDDCTDSIIKTFNQLLGLKDSTYYSTYRSSQMVEHVIKIVKSNISQGNDKFYVDLTDKETMCEERKNRVENKYRQMSVNDQIDLLKEMEKNNTMNAVIRAKIDMKSDNGNLRDPVMIRFINNKMMPTYDLMCPVLDSLDAMSSNKFMIAMRDCNYYDRLEQYTWVQNALGLQQTAVVTFSRLNFESTILKKKTIKTLIQSGKIPHWDDPRLMTIGGIFNRGVSLGGLLNFYWLSGHISMEKRATLQSLDTLFSLNDKILSQHTIFIVDRMPINFVPIVSDNSWMKMIINRVSLTKEFGINELLVTDIVHVKTHRLITHNLKLMNEMIKGIKNEVAKEIAKIEKSTIGEQDRGKEIDEKISKCLDTGDMLISAMNLDKCNFKTCKNIMVGEIIKINNFKNMPDEPIFSGYYKIISIAESEINVIHIS